MNMILEGGTLRARSAAGHYHRRLGTTPAAVMSG
ncbi:MAG: hypothetical protein BMS9Abin29_1762 [Gemmatimonadota bacterium]|nr:MAG: hypothetical protein BMS9Abin29_1762 [Gemmatimonadota bacterium]